MKTTQSENNEVRTTKHEDVWYQCGLPQNFTGYEFACQYCGKIPVKFGVVTEVKQLIIHNHLEAFPEKTIYFCTKRCEKKYKKIFFNNQKIKKVGVGFAFLQSGLVSTMSDEEFEKFFRWLDA